MPHRQPQHERGNHESGWWMSGRLDSASETGSTCLGVIISQVGGCQGDEMCLRDELNVSEAI